MTEQHGQEPTEAEFWNSPIVRGHEPNLVDNYDSVPISLAEASRPDPMDLVVLLHWRFRRKDGQSLTSSAIWASMTEQGKLEGDGTPVTLASVQAAMDRLAADGILPTGGAA
ncbi:hypothetical protein ACFQ6O_43855 [Streptomyces sp. NPDC056441]|uniref:hypothetical protein n=1 Tax=Streptomyces sp. NPDC056441 TaxID=3345817 RepID=UPI00368DFBC4